MDERQELIQEMLIKTLLNKQNENTEILNIISLMIGDIDSQIKATNIGIDEIKKDTEQINKKIDILLEKIDVLENDFIDIKNENRDIEQKMYLLISKLEKVENYIDEDIELEDYYGLCQNIYNNWEEFDSLTRQLIPVAEYLFSKLQKYDKPDYSPVILELCRAIENEFLLKIFKIYTLDLISRKNNKLNDFFITDKSDRLLISKTGEFVRAISKASRTKKPEYTLGQMNKIMSILTDDTIVNRSPLLQDFKKYLKDNTAIKNLLNRKYIKSIDELVKNYRNPSAHPGFMSLKSAEECKDILPEKLDYLMDCLDNYI